MEDCVRSTPSTAPIRSIAASSRGNVLSLYHCQQVENTGDRVKRAQLGHVFAGP